MLPLNDDTAESDYNRRRFALPSAPHSTHPIQLNSGDPAIWCKLEFLNPSGSTKDRIAACILHKAKSEGKLRPGQVVFEASSGSTSIAGAGNGRSALLGRHRRLLQRVAFALACARQGLRFIAVMPEGVSNERVPMIRAFGGEVRFTPREAGLKGAIVESERAAEETNGFLPRQFSNPDNAAAQETGAGREILEQIPGVAGGVSEIFRNAVLVSFSIIEVRQEQGMGAARQLIRRGFPVGPSSGLNDVAAVAAARESDREAKVVTVFPDAWSATSLPACSIPTANPRADS